MGSGQSVTRVYMHACACTHRCAASTLRVVSASGSSSRPTTAISYPSSTCSRCTYACTCTRMCTYVHTHAHARAICTRHILPVFYLLKVSRCQVPSATCHVPRVTCHVSSVKASHALKATSHYPVSHFTLDASCRLGQGRLYAHLIPLHTRLFTLTT